MKRTAIIAIAMLLLLGGVVLQTAASAVTRTSGHDPPARYTVEQGTSSGAGYRLTSLAWQVEGTASGSGYRLLGPAAPTSSENGCCCTYIPCVLRDF